MDAAAMDLLHLDHENYPTGGASVGTKKDNDCVHREDRGNTSSGGEVSFWNDVLDADDLETEIIEECGDTNAQRPIAVSAVEGATPYSCWPAEQWGTVELNVLGTLTEDLSGVERLVGWRPSEEAQEESGQEGLKAASNDRVEEKEMDEDQYEILVKWKGRALPHCSWVPLAALVSALPLASQRLTRFWEKHPKSAGPVVTVSRKNLEVASILGLRDAASGISDEREALVKWGGGLGYEDVTWEREAQVSSYPGGAAGLERFAEVQSRRVSKAAAAARRDTVTVPNDHQHPTVREWYGCEGNVLRAYQQEGVRWMAHNLLSAGRGCILADEMGLGKTAQALALVDYVLRSQHHDPEPTIVPRGPALVVVPLSTLVNWEREAARWVPGAHVVPYVGPPDARAIIRRYELEYDDIYNARSMMDGAKNDAEDIVMEDADVTEHANKKDAEIVDDAAHGTSTPPNHASCSSTVYKADVVLTTYEMVQADRGVLSRVPWSCLVVDEAHRLKNSGGRAVRDLRTMDFAGRVVLLTGTPLQNDTAELWSLLNFVDRRKFASKDEFEMAFGAVKAAGQVEALHRVLAPYLLRRLKCDVEHKLPPRVETLIECELMPLQKKCYRALFERNFSFLRQGCHDQRGFANFSNLMMEIRKCCQHPFLLDGVEEAFVGQQLLKQKNQEGGQQRRQIQTQVMFTASPAQLVSCSGKLQLLDKLLPRLKEGGHRALIFSQMTRVLDVLEDYCRSRGHSYERLDGGVTGKARQAAIDRFCNGTASNGDGRSDNKEGAREECDGAFLFLLSTRAGGQGINLVAADTVIVFDSDWNPQNDAQALARAHRIGQTKPVQVYRLVMRDTYEREMLDRAAMKLGLEQAIFGGVGSGGGGQQGQGENDRDRCNPSGGSSAAAREEIERLLKHGAYGAMTEDAAEGDRRTKEWGATGIDDILARSERRVVEASEVSSTQSEGYAQQKSMFATATFTGTDDGGADGIALDDPDFWQKLMPEAAAAEEAAAEAKAAKEAQQLVDEETEASRAKEVRFEWTWAERKSVICQLSNFGFGQWEVLHAAAKLRPDKTPAHIAAFCRRFVLEASSSLPDNACPFLLAAASSDADQIELPADKGGELTLSCVFSEPLFSSYVRTRAADDIARLELLQPAVDAVAKAGGPSAALLPGASEWLEGAPEVTAMYGGLEPPAPWWTSREDRGLLIGTLRHGYGRYDAMRDDEELGLAAAFAAAYDAKPTVDLSNPKKSTINDESIDADDDIRTRSKRKRSMEAVGKENGDHNRDNKRGAATHAVANEENEEDEKVMVDVEWPSNRVLSLRVRRLCTALSGKAVVPPPVVKVPRPPRVTISRVGRSGKGRGSGGSGTGRGGGPRANAGAGSMDKIARAVLQVAALPRDEAGQVQLPVGPVHGVTVEDLGVVQPPGSQGYNSAAYILPVGYRTTRQYMRCDDPNGPRTRWVQEIIEGDSGSGPIFKLSADDGLAEPIVAKSATAAWAEVLRRVTATREAKGEEAKKTAISGPEFFGYSLPHIRLLIEELPGAAACTEYRPLRERQSGVAQESALPVDEQSS